MKKTLDVSFAQCQQATDSLHYLIESLGKHRDGTPFGSPRRHRSPLLVSGAHFLFFFLVSIIRVKSLCPFRPQPGGQTRFATHADRQGQLSAQPTLINYFVFFCLEQQVLTL